MTPGQLIRSTRERHRLTQKQLALRAATSQNAVSRVENGEVSPTVDTVARLLGAMGEQLELSARRIEGPFDPDGRSRDAPTDPVEIFRVLNEHRVEYLIIGGVAVQAYGHVRTTQDVDVIVSSAAPNLERLAAALRQLRARLKGVDADLLDIDLSDATQLREAADFGLSTRAGGLDVWTDAAVVKGARSWEDIWQRSVTAEVSGQSLRFVHRDDLIRMKLAAGRQQDLEDIAALTSQEGADSPGRPAA